MNIRESLFQHYMFQQQIIEILSWPISLNVQIRLVDTNSNLILMSRFMGCNRRIDRNGNGLYSACYNGSAFQSYISVLVKPKYDFI